MPRCFRLCSVPALPVKSDVYFCSHRSYDCTPGGPDSFLLLSPLKYPEIDTFIPGIVCTQLTSESLLEWTVCNSFRRDHSCGRCVTGHRFLCWWTVSCLYIGLILTLEWGTPRPSHNIQTKPLR
ncbi:hypothetical protein AHF37_09438 [Paragonimus kellicotti]|nr:hypothetical protein AHF37_09438 [Paragonimus kellicotti]